MNKWLINSALGAALIFAGCAEKDSADTAAKELIENLDDGSSPIAPGSENENGDAQTLPSESFQTISGRVVDGYIRNAFACIDVNNNNECDGTEPFVKTDDNGAYAIEIPNGEDLSQARVLVSGGVDNSTGQPFVAIMKAPLVAGESENIFVTPLTTVVVARVDSSQAKNVQSKTLKELNEKSVVDRAISEVADSLGLDIASVTKDPIASADSKLLSATLQV